MILKETESRSIHSLPALVHAMNPNKTGSFNGINEKKIPKVLLNFFSGKNQLEYVFGKQCCITATLSNSLSGCSTPVWSDFIPEKLLYYANSSTRHLKMIYKHNCKYLPHVNQWTRM